MSVTISPISNGDALAFSAELTSSPLIAARGMKP